MSELSPTPSPKSDRQASRSGSQSARESTRTRILEAVRHLMADSHRSGISLRDITREAGVNLAAVNYHFGSRAAMFEELFSHQIRILMQRREERLDQIEDVASLSGKPVSLEQIVDCFLDPAYEMTSEDPEGFELIERIGHQVMLGDEIVLSEDLMRQMGAHLERFANKAVETSGAVSSHRVKVTLLLTSQMLAFRSLEASLRPLMLPEVQGLPAGPPDWDSLLVRLKTFVIRSLEGDEDD